jgi:hypothetical protein
MSSFDLLTAVQPSSGYYAILGIKGVDNTKQFLVQTREEFDELTEILIGQQRNVFFGVAKYTDDSGRKKSNVKALKAFWLDIDCGPTKAAVNPKTQKPQGYLTQEEGLNALRAFTLHVGLPRPIIVNSGRGLHVYWPLVEEVTREQWEPIAERLKALCDANNLYVDPQVFEAARILRVPGTLNFKDNPPTPVTVLTQGKPTKFDDFCKLLGVKQIPQAAPLGGRKRGLTALGQMMQDNLDKSFSKIMRRSANGDGCQQLLDCYQNQTTLSEPRWFDALSVAKFCRDADKAIHKMSSQHPDYNPAVTEQKIAHIEGPHNCATFERNNPGGCAGCPHLGKIKNPIMLGMELKKPEPEPEDDSEEPEDTSGRAISIPEYPFPYERGATGGVFKRPADDEGDPILVYQHDLYVVKRMHDPIAGDVVVMRLHLPADGVREFVISNTKVMDRAELKKELAFHGVAGSTKRFEYIAEYVITAINNLQVNQKAELMRLQFGWVDNDSKFIIGDSEVTPMGVFYSPPSSTTEQFVPIMGPVGSLDKWKEVFNLYGTPGLEAHAFATLTAFGAPLFKFTGQSGAAINVIHPNSGTGKTTILHMCNSVYGHPKEMCATQKDTDNAKIMKLGTYCNLPYCVDEITNMHPMAFSDLIYAMSNGKGKDRMEASGNKLRANNTKWQTISLCSSNASFYEKLGNAKNSPDGEMMRMLEYKIDYNDALDMELAKSMFDHQLMENYGHAGIIYADYLVRNKDKVVATIKQVQTKLDRELKLTQRERFWSAVIAANIVGGLIATKLELINWDMQRIYMWATDMLQSLRQEVEPPVQDFMQVIGSFVNRHISNMLIVNDAVDQRTKLPLAPVLLPKNELLIRWEPDTKKMYIEAGPFKRDCVDLQINYKETLASLTKQGVMLGSVNKRLTKGMGVVAPAVRCIELNGAHSDFALDGLLDTFAGPSNETGGG